MLASITALGERGRRRRWGASALAYGLGSALGGSLMGLAAGLLGAALFSALVRPAPRLLTLVVVALVASGAVVDAAGWRPPAPQRQVDENWLGRYRGWVVGLGFGFQVGLGLATVVTTAAVHLVFALAVLSGSPTVGAALGLCFGLVRAAPIIATARVDTPVRLARLHRRLDGWAGRARWSTACCLSLIAGALLGRGVLG